VASRLGVASLIIPELSVNIQKFLKLFFESSYFRDFVGATLAVALNLHLLRLSCATK